MRPRYYEMTEAGSIVGKYSKPRPFSIGDEMTVSDIHRVIGTALYKFYRCACGVKDRLEYELLVSGLRPAENVLYPNVGAQVFNEN